MYDVWDWILLGCIVAFGADVLWVLWDTRDLWR
jgi:hypothetical protein